MNMFKTTDKFHLLTQKAFKNPNYQLKQHEYMVFWEYIQESSDNVVYFLTELIRMIMHLERSKKSSKLESLDSVIASLYSLSMFKKIYGDIKKLNMIHEVEKEWIAYDKIKDSSLVRSPYSTEILNCIFLFIVKKEDEMVKIKNENILNQIVLIPSGMKKFLDVPNTGVSSLLDIDVNNHIVVEKNLEQFYKAFSTYVNQLENYHKQIKVDSFEVLSNVLVREEFEPYGTGECSFVYEYLVTFMNDNKKTQQSTIPEYILANIVTNLRVITFISVKYPDHAKKSICCLFHLIKQLFTFFPLGYSGDHDEQDFLLDFIGLIKIYKTWPFPVGFLANELVEMLQYEAITIGNNFRYKIREEIPALDILNYDIRKNETYLLIGYCIYGDSYSGLVSGILNINGEKFNDKTNDFIGLDAHKIRVLLIAHIFSLHNEITKELLIHLSGLNPVDVFSIYCKLLETLERCEKVDLVMIKSIQEKALKEMANEIFKFRTDNSETSNKIQSLLFEVFKSFIPVYPEVFLQVIDHRQNNLNMPENQAKNLRIPNNVQINEENSFGEFDVNIEERKIFGNFTLKLKEILEEIKQISLPLHQESFKFVVFGEDMELHCLFQELGVLFKLNYLLFTNIDLRIYVIPLGKNTLGKYIASKDFWYNRSIYLPFNKDLLIPRLEVTEAVGANKNGASNIAPEMIHLNFERSILPFALKEKLVQSYLREANRAFQLNVYEVLCFKQKNESSKWFFRQKNEKNEKNNENNKNLDFIYIPDKSKRSETMKQTENKPSKFLQAVDTGHPDPDETYFFSMYFEIGQSVEIQQLRNSKKMTEEAISELKEKGLLKFKNVELEINANSIDLEGLIHPNEPWTGLVDTLRINNVYKDGFEGNPPIPNIEPLEMTIIDFENSKQRNHSAKHPKISSQYGREQLQNAFFALNMSFSVYSVVITAKGKEFDILVDGKVYEGFQQVIIQPVISQEKKDFKFAMPIMTFLPINV